MDSTRCVLSGVAIALLAIFFHRYFIKVYDYWKKRGVPTVEGAIPLFGNTFSVMTLQKNYTIFCEEICQRYPDKSAVGFYQFRTPLLLVKDPELVKTVLVSSFANFYKNVVTVDSHADPLLAQNPFFTSGEEWKTRRSRLAGALMSGKRLRSICAVVARVCSKFTDYLDDNTKKSKSGVYEVEAKDLFTRFTGEVVASAGFGVEGDFFSNGSGPGSFREVITGAFEPTFSNNMKFLIMFTMPRLAALLGLPFIPKRMDRFFRNIVTNMIEMRKNDETPRGDFLQIALDNHKAEGGEIDVEAVTGSATSFFIDGYETSAVTLGFFAYQVAAHPIVQDKLRAEVNAVLEKHNGEITYEGIAEMTYMEQAFNESMRVYSAVGFMMKRCTQQCTLVGKDGFEYVIDEGTEILIPIQALQKATDYWDNPEEYEPDRFNPENKTDRPKAAFIPFSDGPRACVGMRFAIMQIKAAMATILRRFRIELSPKTKQPLVLSKSAMLAAAEGGIWMNITRL